jgi:predicted TIM-barrel fold metal-dependent hydrolase
VTQVLDAHVHFWDPRARHHDWLAELPPLRRRFGPEDLDTGHHELIGAVFVQADCRDDEALDEVRWVGRLAAEHPVIRGIVAYAPLHEGRSAARHLEALAGEELVVGVRRLLQGLPSEAITSRMLVNAIRLLPDWGLTFDLCATHDQLPAVIELVGACPRTSFILDHVGKPPVASGRMDPWRQELAWLASFPNVVCKLSGLATEAAPGWHVADVRPYLEHALTTFGPQRCMIASDWPVATLQTTVQRWFDVVVDLVVDLDPADRAAVLRDTAAGTYGLMIPPTDARRQ